MKTVYYWSPYLTNVATIRAVINSAASLKKYSKTYNPIIINSCGEFNKYKKELEIDGIEIVTLLSFNLFKFLPSRGFLLSRFSYILIFILTFFPLLIFIKSKKPDYLIMHLITSLPILISNLIKTKTKYILRISGLPKYNFLRKVFWKKFSRNIHKVTCPTEDTIKDLNKNKLFDSEKLILLRDPVIKINEIIKKKRENINGNFNKENFNIVLIGRLTKQKNFNLIINSFDQFLKIKKNCKLTIVGEGEEMIFLKKLIKKNNLSKHIFLVGFKENVFKYLKNSDLFILSSLWEDPGWVLIEAAASDALILSSDCKNGPIEFVQNNMGGLLFKNNSTKDLIMKFKEINDLTKEQILKKKIFAKKQSKKFTIFEHYLSFEKVLN